ncbi:MAG TPA: UMP kinase [Candidatus Thermoplasmatota archaeon]|jgi:uridylate kinase|nr:UMP kinase [Candidatus Thermoplasmatota archaeon]
MDAVVVSVGGSIFLGPEGPDAARTRAVAAVLREASRNARLIAVVGGGLTARRYIEAARSLGENEAALDDLGIVLTRANARVLLAALPEASPTIPTNFDDALLASKSYPIVILGGTHAGHTTDAVAAMAAERARAARLVIATNVDGVYDSDPKSNPQAKFLARVSAQELVKLTIAASQRAGSAGVVDPLAAKLIARARIPTLVVNGTKLDELAKALAGKTFHGTVVEPEKP